jgi:phosphoglycerate dehydrogenase-like enzyme
MTDLTQVLLMRAAYERILPLLEEAQINIDPILVEMDGTLSHEGNAVTIEQVNPKATWLSIDAMIGGPVREFAITILKSETLTWMQTGSAGFDNPMFKMVLDKGVRLTNSDAQAPAIAEYVLAQVLAHFQPTFERVEAQANRTWTRLSFREISQTTWMIIGYGNIGQEIGKRAKGFDAHVIGVRHSGRPADYADEMLRQSDLLASLPKADVVVLACPLNEDTRLMANGNFFAQMKEGATLVNIGRGDLVDEDALLTALDSGTLDAALLDVFRTEPLPEESPLWAHPKVRVTAHTSASSTGTVARGDQLFVGNLKKFLAGDPLKNEVKEID